MSAGITSLLPSQQLREKTPGFFSFFFIEPPENEMQVLEYQKAPRIQAHPLINLPSPPLHSPQKSRMGSSRAILLTHHAHTGPSLFPTPANGCGASGRCCCGTRGRGKRLRDRSAGWTAASRHHCSASSAPSRGDGLRRRSASSAIMKRLTAGRPSCLLLSFHSAWKLRWESSETKALLLCHHEVQPRCFGCVHPPPAAWQGNRDQGVTDRHPTALHQPRKRPSSTMMPEPPEPPHPSVTQEQHQCKSDLQGKAASCSHCCLHHAAATEPARNQRAKLTRIKAARLVLTCGGSQACSWLSEC
ncbi:uncharacterized protein LOC125702916 [Lagopus muta]|uniref:uncharacterized protein LOC125702916 n=1 Tax=Lagopus muta TaxID=64668 RepID=UPI00209D210F|nr:uncharacterized protein LOC125702916 [Lagopus muta]